MKYPVLFFLKKKRKGIYECRLLQSRLALFKGWYTEWQKKEKKKKADNKGERVRYKRKLLSDFQKFAPISTGISS